MRLHNNELGDGYFSDTTRIGMDMDLQTIIAICGVISGISILYKIVTGMKCPTCSGKLKTLEFRSSGGLNITKTIAITARQNPNKDTETTFICKSCKKKYHQKGTSSRLEEVP